MISLSAIKERLPEAAETEISAATVNLPPVASLLSALTVPKAPTELLDAAVEIVTLVPLLNAATIVDVSKPGARSSKV